MPDVISKPSLDFPDDPHKWDGWSKYNSENLYERLCLNPRSKPNEEQIQQHCTALLQWWQKKLRLKNQPSNPLAQLLGRGIDEASRFLVEARMKLLDPVERQRVDDEMTARDQEETLSDFAKYVAFSLSRRVLSAEAEANLSEFGQRKGLTPEQTRACIEQELQRHKAQRITPARPAAPVAVAGSEESAKAEDEFLRILKLSELDMGDATGLVRRIFVTIAEKLGIDFARAEDVLDEFLERDETATNSTPAVRPHVSPAMSKHSKAEAPVPSPANGSATADEEHAAVLPAEFFNPTGAPMVLIPAGEFLMGSDAKDAAPNEQPLTPVSLSRFYLSRHPVTNAEYEQFDPAHRQKRMPSAADDHPVVYVSSVDAIRFCDWLRHKDGRNYRLPTEAEWEYAARGTDRRRYPWGNHDRRGGFANFADASTSFPWRDQQINDGYPETSPVGAFPCGASFFGIHDMAGNVWEWCLDFYQPLLGAPRHNPRGAAAGATRVYRGGSWKSRFANLRATARSSNAPNYASNDVGFRIVCECAGDSQ